MHLDGFTIEIYYDARPYERETLLACEMWLPRGSTQSPKASSNKIRVDPLGPILRPVVTHNLHTWKSLEYEINYIRSATNPLLFNIMFIGPRISLKVE